MRAGLLCLILLCHSLAGWSAFDSLPVNYYPLYFYEFGLNRKDYVTLNFFELEYYTRINQSKKQSRMIASITIEPKVQQGITPDGTRYNISYEYNDPESEFENVPRTTLSDPDAPCDPAVDQCINNAATIEYQIDGIPGSVTSNTVSTRVQGAQVSQVCDDYGYCEPIKKLPSPSSHENSNSTNQADCRSDSTSLQSCYATIAGRLSALNAVVTCKDGKPTTDPIYLNQLSTIQSSCNSYLQACSLSCRSSPSDCDNKSSSQIHAVESAQYTKISQQETRCASTVPKDQAAKIIADIKKTNEDLDATKRPETSDLGRSFTGTPGSGYASQPRRPQQPPSYQQPRYANPQPIVPPPAQGYPRGTILQPPPNRELVGIPRFPSYPTTPSQPINLPKPDYGSRNSFKNSDLSISFNSNTNDSLNTGSPTQGQQQGRPSTAGGLAQYGSQGGVGSSPSLQSKPSQFDTQRPQFSRENGASTYSIQVHSGFESNFGRRMSFSSFSTPSIPFHQAVGFRGGLTVKAMQLKAATGKKKRLNLLQFLPMFRSPASETSDAPPTQLAKCSHHQYKTERKGITKASGPSNFDKIACRYQVQRGALRLYSD